MCASLVVGRSKYRGCGNEVKRPERRLTFALRSCAFALHCWRHAPRGSMPRYRVAVSLHTPGTRG
jgi:hypothetical protein